MFDLDALVAPKTAAEFIRDYWPHRPVHIAGGADKLNELHDDVPLLASSEDILTRFTDRVSILRPDGFYANVPNGISALPFYSAEYTCFLRRVERFLPELDPVVTALANDLGMPRYAFSCDIFTSTGNDATVLENTAGLAMHSDAEVSLALLICGRKQWRWAPNTHIENQTSTVVRDGDRQVDPSQLELAHRLPMPRSMPPESEIIDVSYGGLVFLPRGWWHTTTAFGQCLQLNFTMHGPTWIDVFSSALSKQLTRKPNWREYAYGIAGTEEQRARAHAAIGTMLNEFTKSLRTETATQELLRAMLGVDRPTA